MLIRRRNEKMRRLVRNMLRLQSRSLARFGLSASQHHLAYSFAMSRATKMAREPSGRFAQRFSEFQQ